MHHKTPASPEKQKIKTFKAKNTKQSTSRPQNLSLVITSKPLNKQELILKTQIKIASANHEFVTSTKAKPLSIKPDSLELD